MTAIEYTYDANGNTFFVNIKGINNIFYNHLNIPVRIFFSNGNRIYYTYDAQGVKLKKEILENSGTTTDYLDGFQYKNEVLSFILTSEGYVEFKEPARFFYVYNYTDHLGNVRMSYTDNRAAVPKILEESHYYPFGLKHENYASERFERIREPNGDLYVIQPTERREWQYKYNGKEWQDELGLNMYDYGFRNYDPAIGRWINPDPLSEEYRRWSPYNYCMDNPVIFTDPDGMYVDTAWIYQKDKNGNYKNKALVEAFETFAKSKSGIAFLANFAEKGQVIAGHEYKESGSFDKKDIDLNFGALQKGDWADARTSSVEKGDGLQITISLSDSGTKVDNYIDDIGHEAFAHADIRAKDFSDDKKLDLSVIDKDIVKGVDDAIKKGYPKNYRSNAAHHLYEERYKVLEKKLVPILRNYYKSKNVKKTDEEIKKSVNEYQK